MRLKNIATDEYMHIENLSGYVEHGKVPSTYWSAQWSVKQVDKADIVERAFFGPVTPEVPASILQLHNDVTLVGDEAALAKIGI